MQQSAGRFWNELEQTMNPLFYYLTKPLISLVNWRTYLHAYASSFPSLRQDKQEDIFFWKKAWALAAGHIRRRRISLTVLQVVVYYIEKKKNRG